MTVILFAFGCYTNVTYSSKCKIGERVDEVILSRDFSPGSRSAEWYYEYEIDITDEDTHVTAYSSKYYKEGDIVTCYVATSDVQKERKSIIEGSNECKKGNRLITVAGYVLIFELGIWCIQNKF